MKCGGADVCFAEMQFWLRFPLLNVVVWMALTTHAEEESFCKEGCLAHKISGIALPVDDIQHNISVLQEEDSHIYFANQKIKTLGKKWYSITTRPRDGEICIASPGLLREPGYCNDPDEFVDIAVFSENSLWKLDCNGDSCECQHHRLIALRIGRDLVSKVFWWPPQNISKVVVAIFLYSDTENVATFEVPSPPKWHDFATVRRNTGYAYQLMSSSLYVNDSRNGQKVWIYGINDDGEKIPSYFALGCDEEPTEYPGEGTANNEQQRITIGWYPALGVLPLVLLVAVVLIIRFRTRGAGQITDLALKDRLPKDDHEYSYIDTEALRIQLERERAEGLGTRDPVDRKSTDNHEYCYINAKDLRIQLEREKVEGLGPRDPVRDSVDRRSVDNHEYCYIDAEDLRIQLEREKVEGLGPRDPVRDSVDRRSADNHEYCYIDAEALRIQFEKEKRERLEGQSRRKISTTSHESKNSLYEELTAGER